MPKILSELNPLVRALLLNFLILGISSDGHQEHQKLIFEKYSRIRSLQLNLTHKIDLLQTEKLDALTRHEEDAKKLKELQQQENNLRRTIGKLNHDIALKTDEITRCNTTVNHVTTQSGKLNEEITSLKAQLESARKDLESLQTEIDTSHGPEGLCRIQGEGCAVKECASLFSCCCRGLHCEAVAGAYFGFCRRK